MEKEVIGPLCPICEKPVNMVKFKIYHGQFMHIECFQDKIGYPDWWKPKNLKSKKLGMRFKCE